MPLDPLPPLPRPPDPLSVPLPLWINAPGTLDALAARLAVATAVALDTEADSLHHYPGKLCLVQVADDRGDAHLVDPLALPDLRALGPVLADPGVTKVLHAADNDLAYLKGNYGFTIASLFDTAIAARFLGVTSLGLDGLLRRFLGLEPGPSRQRDDWSRRPLTPAQEAYAVDDVRHLLALRERLAADLRASGRERWVEEECAALAAQPAPQRAPDPDAYFALKGARDLDGQGLAVLRELHRTRERLALELDRPPFMVLGHDTLVALAARRPGDEAALLEVPGCTTRVVRRFGAAVLEAIERGRREPEAGWPVRQRLSRPTVPAAVRRRVEALKVWRRAAAERLGLEPGVVLAQRVIDRLAAEPPADVEALARVDGVRRWRAEVLGAELVKTLRSA